MYVSLHDSTPPLAQSGITRAQQRCGVTSAQSLSELHRDRNEAFYRSVQLSASDGLAPSPPVASRVGATMLRRAGEPYEFEHMPRDAKPRTTVDVLIGDNEPRFELLVGIPATRWRQRAGQRALTS